VRKGVPCLVLDFTDMRRTMGLTVDGILGFSAINRYAVTFDFEHEALELAENASARSLSSGAARVRFEMLGGQVLAPVRVDGGEPMPFIVDTGAWVTFVPARVGRKLDSPRRVPGVPFVGADGRALEAEAVRAKSLSVGSARVDRPVVLFATKGGVSDPSGLTLAGGDRGILGANFLRRFRVTLDYPRSEIVLEPVRARIGATPEETAEAEDGQSEFGLVGPGLVLRGESGVARVAAVVEGSSAARAGIGIGERVLAVDGRTMSADDIAQAGALLSGPAGSDVRVRLVSKTGRERTVRLTRAPLL
jgi:predicted aspartyl protease